MTDAKKRIVISAINLREGGPLSILTDCLRYVSSALRDRYSITALVHDADLVGVPDIDYIEFASSKRSWLRRLYLEYVDFRRLSLELRPYLWLSLHDITPNVVAERQAVYCHNPAPFHPFSLRDLYFDPAFAAFALFYGELYRINIRRNKYVVVQQEWIRREFRKRYGAIPLIVAYPHIRESPKVDKPQVAPVVPRTRHRLLFPTFPRTFKNIETIGEACRILDDAGRSPVEVSITIDGTENRYAKWLRDRYGDVSSIAFIGRQPRSEVFRLYSEVDALVFPSRLETWGLPISEFKTFQKPILAADLPYAHETVGEYGRVKFFSPDDPVELADCMRSLAQGTLQFDETGPPQSNAATAHDWAGLFRILLEDSA